MDATTTAMLLAAVGVPGLAAVVVAAVLGVRLRRHGITARRTARRDALTGLGNRRALVERTGALLEREGCPQGTRPALLLVDLDAFKEINDTLGHGIGDAVLVQVAQQLHASVPSGAQVHRLGGDEFAILLASVASAEEAALLGKQVLAALSVGHFHAGEVTLDLQASIGVAVAPAHGASAGELLRHADIAMYEAKRGRSGVAVYERALDPHSTDRLELLGQLRTAMELEELVLHYQPKVSARTGAVVGVEALLRWQHPTRGLLPPGEFVALAERTNLIHALTRWVLLTAVQQTAHWRAAGIDVSVAVNVSPTSLDEGLLGILEEALARSRTDASQLVIEITETAVMADPAGALRTIGMLRERGVRVAVDDFGAGYTSLGQLRGLPVHQLKIDQQFVLGLATSAEDDVVVAALIDLGHLLGFEVVAEGVETEAAAQRLRELGCDELQGYLIARPMPASQLAGWMRQRVALEAPALEAPALEAPALEAPALEEPVPDAPLPL